MLLPALLAKHLGELLGFLDGRRADQHRLAALLAVLDQAQNGAVFLGGGAINLVIIVEADHWHVGRDFKHLEIVDVDELVRLRQGRARHAGKLLVHAEVILEGNGSERLVLRLNRLVLLRFQSLMQPFRIASARHHATGEFVNDDDLAVTHDVVLVAMKQLVRAQRLIHMVDSRDIFHVVEMVAFEQIGTAQHLLHLLHPHFAQRDGALLLVNLVVGLVQLGDIRIYGVVEIGPIIERSRDDQGRARLVDQDEVDLVDDGEDVPALDHVLQPVFHVVAQVVEAQLIVGTVSDVRVVGLLALLIIKAVNDHAHLQTQEIVDLAHPLGVAFCQVVVDRHHVHSASGERVEVHRQRRHQRLAFAGLHLGDAPLVQDHPADKLHVEMTLSQRALGCFAAGRKRGHQKIVQGRPCGNLLLERLRPSAQFLVRERFELALQGVDLCNPRQVAFDAPLVGRTKQLAGDSSNHAEYPCILAGASLHSSKPALKATACRKLFDSPMLASTPCRKHSVVATVFANVAGTLMTDPAGLPRHRRGLQACQSVVTLAHVVVTMAL